jgi:GNAT superfamily N-acetyltransferase
MKLLAPNGNKSNLTAKQYELVRTTEFKAWFGDWENLILTKLNDSGIDEVSLKRLEDGVSKVLDENGEPLVVYHYTNIRFNEFRLKGLSDAFFFTKYKNDDEFSYEQTTTKKYFLNIKNMHEVIDIPYYEWSIPYYESQYIKKGRLLGADGLILTREGFDNNFNLIPEKSIILSFNPTQIKLADGSNTTFDSNNPDIRFDGGGRIREIDVESIEVSDEIGYFNDLIFNELEEDEILEGFVIKYYHIKNIGLVNVQDDKFELGVGYIWGLEVFEEYKGKGFGKKIMEKIFILHPTQYAFRGIATKTSKGFWLNLGAEFDESDEYSFILSKDKLNYSDGGSILLAPNGKPSNLTPEQYKLVRTPAFKEWFGDWENDPENASKVVDSNGEPLVVFHGSNIDFNIFEKSKTNPYAEKQGYFFAFDKKYAESYNSKYVKPFFINIRIKGTFDDDDNLVPFNADGNIVQGLQVEVYDKKNIKLADGSNTTLDGNNPDIRFDYGGKVGREFTGQEVWDIALKGGSEHNDTLEYLEQDIISKDYFLKDISVNEILTEDIDVMEFVNEMKNNTSSIVSIREIHQPIVIGHNPYSGKNSVIDGSNRVLQAINNGQETIKGFVPVDSKTFNDDELKDIIMKKGGDIPKLYRGGDIEQYNKWKAVDWDSFNSMKQDRSKIYRLMGWHFSNRIDWDKMPKEDREFFEEDVVYALNEDSTLEYLFSDDVKEISGEYEDLLEDERLEDIEDIKKLNKKTTELLNSKEFSSLKEKMDAYGFSEKDLQTKSDDKLLKIAHGGKDIEWITDYVLLNDDNWYNFNWMFYPEDLPKIYDEALERGAVFTEEAEMQQYDMFTEAPAKPDYPKALGLQDSIEGTSILLQEIDSELEVLNDLLEVAKEEKNKGLISELKDRIDFLEELRDDEKEGFTLKNGGEIADISKINIIFNNNYLYPKVYFFIEGKNGKNIEIGYSYQETYSKDINTLTLHKFIIEPKYNTPANFKKIVELIKEGMNSNTGKTKLIINNVTH